MRVLIRSGKPISSSLTLENRAGSVPVERRFAAGTAPAPKQARVECPFSPDENLDIDVSAFASGFGCLFVASVEGRVIAIQGPTPGARDPLAWARWRWPERPVRRAGPAHREINQQFRAYFAGRSRGFNL